MVLSHKNWPSIDHPINLSLFCANITVSTPKKKWIPKFDKMKIAFLCDKIFNGIESTTKEAAEFKKKKIPQKRDKWNWIMLGIFQVWFTVFRKWTISSFTRASLMKYRIVRPQIPLDLKQKSMQGIYIIAFDSPLYFVWLIFINLILTNYRGH